MPVRTGSVKITDAKKDAGVAALVELVVEIELEIGELFIVDDQVAARAMRVEAVCAGYETLEAACLLQSIQPLVALAVEDRVELVFERAAASCSGDVGGRLMPARVGLAGVPSADHRFQPGGVRDHGGK